MSVKNEVTRLRILNEKSNQTKLHLNTAKMEASLLVQWLRLHAPSAGVRGSIPEQGTESDLLIDPAYLITDPARPNK